MAKALRLLIGKAIAYLGVCISLGERPAAWTVMVWSKAQMERARREYAERERTLNSMISEALHGPQPLTPKDYTELPALSGHGRIG